MHSTDDMNDTYLGSGLRLRRSIKKYGTDQHKREILEELPTRVAAAEREKELITIELRADPKCLNCGVGGLGAVDRPTTSAETNQKKSAAMKKLAADPEWRAFKKAAHSHPTARENNRIAQREAQNRPGVRKRTRLAKSKRCTIDGVFVFGSLKELVTQHGQGKAGMRHPNFQYL